ncbi:hypothetical protein DIPPA_08297 [Diplonema papillatum]|nr:hypothetical protein DIPPA_08297 [Diplonema papillatum]
MTLPDSPAPSLTHHTSCRRVSSVTVLENLEHDVVLTLDASLCCVSQGRKMRLEENVELQARKYDTENLPKNIIETLEPRLKEVGKVVDIFVVGTTVIALSKATIVMKNAPLLYVVIMAGRFLEIHLSEDVDEEEIEVLEDVLESSTVFRVKGGQALEGRVPVVLGHDGKLLLQDGFGDDVGRVIRSSAHFLAKRVDEYLPQLLTRIRDLSGVGKQLLKECPPGSELRIQEETINKLRLAAMVVRNASQNIKSNRNVLRDTSKKAATHAGDAVHASKFGEQMARNRFLQETRRIAVASIDGADELCKNTAGLPEKLLRAVSDAVLEVVGHRFGNGAKELGTHGFDILVEFLATKWAIDWALPSALALTGVKSALRAAADKPSTGALSHLAAKRDNASAEARQRQLILQSAGVDRDLLGLH